MWLGRKVIYHHAPQGLHGTVQARRRRDVRVEPGYLNAQGRRRTRNQSLDFGMLVQAIRHNVAKDEDAASPVEKLADAERIRQLERENKRLREERDILRKAAKYFAEETTW